MPHRFPGLIVALALTPAASAQPASTPAAADQPSLVSLQGSFSVAQILDELERQTGNTIADRRAVKDDTKIQLNLTRVAFWQALDQVARAADLSISLYGEDGRVALANGPYRAVPVSYGGPFRIALKKMTSIRDFENEQPTGVAYFEVAWEPRLQIFYVEGRPDSYAIQDSSQKTVPIQAGRSGQASAAGRAAVLMEVHFTMPARPVARLALLEGKLSAIGSSQRHVFTFARPPLRNDGQRVSLAEPQTQTRAGTTATLEEFTVNDGPWQIGLRLKFPPSDVQLESYQATVGDNQIFLVKPGTRFPCNSRPFHDQVRDEATVSYLFVEEPARKRFLGKPEDWSIEYHTHGQISRIPFTFRFQDVPLP